MHNSITHNPGATVQISQLGILGAVKNSSSVCLSDLGKTGVFLGFFPSMAQILTAPYLADWE